MLFFSIHTLIKQGVTNLIFILLLSCAAFAQTGTLQGKIVEKFAGSTDPIIGAIIRIEGTSKSAVTDTAGAFIIENIDPGTYSIQISYIGSAPKTEPNILIEGGKTTRLAPINLLEDTKVTDEVIITGTRQTGTEMSVINEVKKLDVVASAIGSEQIKRTLDRDAADVARRVSGVTVVDNRFIIVRGLSERYNTVMLNGAIAPSFEQDVRSFSLDNLPSQYIDRMVIYKSPSADLPGDFSGGVVKIYTPGMPDKNFFNVGFSSSVRQGTTFHDFQNTSKGKYANYGYDDGTYGLPQDLPPDFRVAQGSRDYLKYDRIKIGQLFRNDTWVANKVNADPDFRFNIQGGQRIKLGSDKMLAFIIGSNYSKTFQIIQQGQRALLTPEGDELSPRYASEMMIHDRTVKLGAIANIIFQLNNNNSIELKNTYSHVGNNRFRNFYYTSANNIDRKTPTNAENNNKINLYNTFSGMLSSQLSGRHSLHKSTEFNWQLGYAKAERDEPDIKAYDYIIQKGKYSWAGTNTGGDPTQLGRQFFKTIEEVKTVSGDITKKTIIDIYGETELSLKSGWYLVENKRQFQSRGYGYVPKLEYPDGTGYYNDIDINSITPENINEPKSWDNSQGLVIVPGNGDGSYNALIQTNAIFLMPKIEWREKLKVTAGMRLENFSQNINSLKLIKNNWLPSINASYSFTKKFLIRGSFGKTVNRPEVREAAYVDIFDYYLQKRVIGNPKVKTAEVNNFDLKFEYYFSPDEYLSLGGFYKEIQNPIERFIIDVNGTGANANDEAITYINGKFASSRGIEFETRKSLRNLLVTSKRDLLKNFAFYCNASINESKIVYEKQHLFDQGVNGLKEENNQVKGILNSKSRRMFGQSPYIINAGFTFNSDKTKSTINLVYNVVGNRLTFIIPGVGSIYEVPRHVLDLTYIQQLNKYVELKFGIQDLLNQKIQFVQDNNGDGNVKRLKDTGYSTDPNDPKNIYGGAEVHFTTADRPADKTEAQVPNNNYNLGDTQFIGFKRGSYYSLGLTVKF
ncbi:MAG: TonB-dependent receptor [Opitutaceae bacterium]|nr:TonB-dependent receptor [Cytophagales bacterium]